MKKKISRIRDIKFNTYPDKRGLVRFRVLAGNGKILAKSVKGYKDISEVVDIVMWLTAELRVPNIYQDKIGQYRWRVRIGETIAIASSESYTNRDDCKRSAWLVLESTLK